MNGKRLLYWCCIIICASGMIFFGAKFIQEQKEYHTGETAYTDLADSAVKVQEPSKTQEAQMQQSAIAEEHTVLVDFGVLTQTNPDVAGWLYGSDSVLSYPVVQGEDNSFYLSHLFDGTENSAGCLFIDSRWDAEQDQNCVIYGHHMKNGTMFASLEKYQDQAYYDEHPTLLWITPEGTWTVELFSAYTTATDSNAWQMHFSSTDEYRAWLNLVQARSCFVSSFAPQEDDQILTLSTCSYAYEDARFVCHGVIRKN